MTRPIRGDTPYGIHCRQWSLHCSGRRCLTRRMQRNPAQTRYLEEHGHLEEHRCEMRRSTVLLRIPLSMAVSLTTANRRSSKLEPTCVNSDGPPLLTGDPASSTCLTPRVARAGGPMVLNLNTHNLFRILCHIHSSKASARCLREKRSGDQRRV